MYIDANLLHHKIRKGQGKGLGSNASKRHVKPK